MVLDSKSLSSVLLSTVLVLFHLCEIQQAVLPGFVKAFPSFCDPFCCQLKTFSSQTDDLLAKLSPSCSERIQNRFSSSKCSLKTSSVCVTQPGSSGCWYCWEKEHVETVTVNGDGWAFYRKNSCLQLHILTKSRFQVLPPFPRSIPSPSTTCSSCLAYQ